MIIPAACIRGDIGTRRGARFDPQFLKQQGLPGGGSGGQLGRGIAVAIGSARDAASAAHMSINRGAAATSHRTRAVQNLGGGSHVDAS
jgi:uncharacterized membrane protein YphA (DoxX/SURF4 family)